MPPLALGAAFTSLPCALMLQAETSLYIVTQLIREARTIANNAVQAFTFLFGSLAALSAMCFISQCLLLPPILQGYQILWTTTVLLPIVTISFIFSARDVDMMTRMPSESIPVRGYYICQRPTTFHCSQKHCAFARSLEIFCLLGLSISASRSHLHRRFRSVSVFCGS
jgi:hypothetical protein